MLLNHNCTIVNVVLMAATKFINLLSIMWLISSYTKKVIDKEKSFYNGAEISKQGLYLNIFPNDSKYAHQFFDISEDS